MDSIVKKITINLNILLYIIYNYFSICYTLNELLFVVPKKDVKQKKKKEKKQKNRDSADYY